MNKQERCALLKQKYTMIKRVFLAVVDGWDEAYVIHLDL